MKLFDYIKSIFLNKKFSTKNRGGVGEDKAVKYLKSKNYRIINRNYSNKSGEIDIIAADGDITVFVEVKYRVNNIYRKGFDAVDKQKQKKIVRTANFYCVQNSITGLYRFDIVSIDTIDGKEVITHIIDAFRGAGNAY